MHYTKVILVRQYIPVYANIYGREDETVGPRAQIMTCRFFIRTEMSYHMVRIGIDRMKPASDGSTSKFIK